MTSPPTFVTQTLHKYYIAWVTLQLLLRHDCVIADDNAKINSESVVYYQKASQCPNQTLTAAGLIGGSYRTRSKVQCAGLCAPNLKCVAFMFDKARSKCHLGSQPAAANCSNMESAVGMQLYDVRIACREGGKLYSEGKCICPYGYIGEKCDMLMRDCDDGKNRGKLTEDGVYWIWPVLATSPFPVLCRMNDRPRTYVFNRLNNDVNFTRSWTDYKHGFGDLEGDFWMGLEKLHLITNSNKYEFRFRVRMRTNTNLFQFYKDVSLDTERNHYRLTFTQDDIDEGALGDSLSYVHGANFSTVDRDNDDQAEVHCAQRHMAGFWFQGEECGRCNPTGPLLQPEDQQRLGVPAEVFWTETMGQTVPYKLGAYLVNVIVK